MFLLLFKGEKGKSISIMLVVEFRMCLYMLGTLSILIVAFGIILNSRPYHVPLKHRCLV